jgi:hypothetical protein
MTPFFGVLERCLHSTILGRHAADDWIFCTVLNSHRLNCRQIRALFSKRLPRFGSVGASNVSLRRYSAGVMAMDRGDPIQDWLTEKRRMLVLLGLLGSVLAVVLGMGGLFLIYWMIVMVLNGVLSVFGVLSSAGGPIQLWQLHCTAGLGLLFLFAWSYWLRLRSDETKRLFDLVSWGEIAEGCRGPRLSFFRGTSAMSLVVDVILLSPHLIVASYQLAGMMLSWLRVRRIPAGELLAFLVTSPDPIGLKELEHLFWQRSIGSILEQLTVLDGVIVGGGEVSLSCSIRAILQQRLISNQEVL